MEAVIEKAKVSINLADLGIKSMKFATTRTGGHKLKISRRDSGDKADALVSRLKEFCPDEKVKVSRPEKRVNVRMTGLDGFTSAEQVAVAVIRDTGTVYNRTIASNMRHGRGPGSKSYLIILCPLVTAKALKGVKEVDLGWV